MIHDLLKFTFGSIVGCALLAGISNIVDAVNQPITEIKLPLSTSYDHTYFRFQSGAVEGSDKFCEQNRQCKKLAEAIFFESRGEPIRGQYAVAFAIINRRDSWRWPDEVEDVIAQRIRGVCQFSYVCDLDEETREEMIASRVNADDWKKSLDIAYDVYYYEVQDFTNGADHFYNPKKVSRTPHFANVYEFVTVIGDHKFYRSAL